MFHSPRTPPAVTLDWIRHGEPEGGLRYRGSIDDPLSATGWAQMQQATDQAQADGTRWQSIVSSPMRRCQAFAGQLAEQLALPITILPDLRELGFGDLEGLTPQEAWEQYPELLQRIWDDPAGHSPPGGEPYPQFRARVAGALEQILQQSEPPAGQHSLLVAHGGVIRAALCHFLHLSPRDSFRVEVPYAGISRLRWFAGEHGTGNASLVFLNRYYSPS